MYLFPQYRLWASIFFTYPCIQLPEKCAATHINHQNVYIIIVCALLHTHTYSFFLLSNHLDRNVEKFKYEFRLVLVCVYVCLMSRAWRDVSINPVGGTPSHIRQYDDAHTAFAQRLRAARRRRPRPRRMVCAVHHVVIDAKHVSMTGNITWSYVCPCPRPRTQRARSCTALSGKKEKKLRP